MPHERDCLSPEARRWKSAERVSKLRALLKMKSQQMLATKAGVGRSQIYKIETARKNVSLSTWTNVAKALFVPADEIMPGKYDTWTRDDDQLLQLALQRQKDLAEPPALPSRHQANEESLGNYEAAVRRSTAGGSFPAPRPNPATLKLIDPALTVKLGLLLGPIPAGPGVAEEVIAHLYEAFFPDEDYCTDWHAKRELLEWAEVAWAQIVRFSLKSEATAKLLYKSGWLARELGNYELAERYLQKAASICGEQGWDGLKTFCLTELANLHYFQRKHDLAIKEYRQVVDLRIQSGMSDEWVAQAYCNLGTALIEVSDYDGARRNINEALTYWAPSVANDDTREWAWGLLSLASVELHAGCFPQAMTYCQAGMTAQADNIGVDHPLMSYFYSKKSDILLGLRSPSRAETPARAAYENWKGDYGASHPLIAGFGFVLAKAVGANGADAEAFELLEQAEGIEETVNPSSENSRLLRIRDYKQGLLARYRSQQRTLDQSLAGLPQAGATAPMTGPAPPK
jgi:tetratricopeptide (TPR) repeat protein